MQSQSLVNLPTNFEFLIKLKKKLKNESFNGFKLLN